MENIALIIPTKPARKVTGFRGSDFSSEPEIESSVEDEELVDARE